MVLALHLKGLKICPIFLKKVVIVNTHFLKYEYLKYAFEYLNFEYFLEIHFEQNFHIPNNTIIVQTVLEFFY